MKKFLLTLPFGIAFALTLISCAGNGPKVTETALVTVAELQQQPDRYQNQNVLVQGTITFGGKKRIIGDASLLKSSDFAKSDEIDGEIPYYTIRQGQGAALVIVPELFQEVVQVRTGLVTVHGLWRKSSTDPSFFYLQPLRVELRVQTAQDTTGGKR